MLGLGGGDLRGEGRGADKLRALMRKFLSEDAQKHLTGVKFRKPERQLRTKCKERGKQAKQLLVRLGKALLQRTHRGIGMAIAGDTARAHVKHIRIDTVILVQGIRKEEGDLLDLRAAQRMAL